MKKFFYTLIILFGTMGSLQAETFIGYPIAPENTQISLLTCSPGDLIYELFGHTAIRIQDDSHKLDFVVNYGLFDFDQPHFVYRFVRGKTDYTVGVSYTRSFIQSYAERGSSITESTLNLTLAEKQDLLNRLNENLQPENRIYRYNFIYNNCATKVRDIFDMSIKRKLSYPTHVDSYSFREAIMLYTETAPWSQLGFDLCLGARADRTATQREMLFLPEVLGETYASAMLTDSTGTQPLCLQTSQIIPATQEKGTAWFSPTLCAYLLLLMVLYASFFLNKHKIWLKRMDVVLFTINGIGGCIILFLILYSQHPFTGQNYNILWMNPLTLFPLITCIFPFMKKINGLFYLGATVMFLGFVIVMPILPQVFNLAVLPWVLTLLLRSYLRLSDIRKRHKDRIRI
ncbi:MAG: DUF4105 domain-containing protein [Paludibacteraceae bacterium]|nr:DUF4105 domain-containing protein [Paludibacteraceae bacterium]MEE1174923.1 DUF4105 domain-containing protein [Paludibacteraceae bacterium]